MAIPTLGRWQQDRYDKKRVIAVFGWNEKATYEIICECKKEEDAAFIVSIYNKANPQ